MAPSIVLFCCSYVIPSLAASVVINIPKYFESTLDYYAYNETASLDNGTAVNVTHYQVGWRLVMSSFIKR